MTGTEVGLGVEAKRWRWEAGNERSSFLMSLFFSWYRRRGVGEMGIREADIV